MLTVDQNFTTMEIITTNITYTTHFLDSRIKALSPVWVSLLQELILLFGAGVGLQLFDNRSGDSGVHVDLTEQNLSDTDK